jgi:hypothetical protein
LGWCRDSTSCRIVPGGIKGLAALGHRTPGPPVLAALPPAPPACGRAVRTRRQNGPALHNQVSGLHVERHAATRRHRIFGQTGTLTLLGPTRHGDHERAGSSGPELRTNYGPGRSYPAHLNGQPWIPARCRSRSTTIKARCGGQRVMSSWLVRCHPDDLAHRSPRRVCELKQ